MLRKFNRLQKTLRVILGMITGYIIYPIAWFWPGKANDPLSKAVADILIIGFQGSNTYSPSARLLARQVRQGHVGSIFFVNENISTSQNVKKLTSLFKLAKNNCLIAIDHEGGIVQRLTEKHGFTMLPAAKNIAQSNFSSDELEELYAIAGKELHTFNFDVNLGPVVDIDDPENEAIGIHGRSFSKDADEISLLATAFVSGFRRSQILCTLKHFPGHGRSKGDSHDHVANISQSWREEELKPFANLINSGHAPIIMCGHLQHLHLEPTNLPVTFSQSIIKGLLRENLGFQGVVLTDDLDMGAISHLFNRRAAFIQAIIAGNDLLMIKNLFNYDPLLPHKAVRWVRHAIACGELHPNQIFDAANRVRALKEKRNLYSDKPN